MLYKKHSEDTIREDAQSKLLKCFILLIIIIIIIVIIIIQV